MKFLDVFEPIQKGNFGLTDEAIYTAIQQEGTFVPVYGAYHEHLNPFRFIPKKGRTKYNEPITVFNGEGIIINFDGVSAGRMTYKANEVFALNHHAGFFKVKEEARCLVVPEYFAIFYQRQLQEASVSSDQKTLTVDMIYSMNFDVPSFPVQKVLMDEIRPLLLKKERNDLLLERICTTKNRVLAQKYSSYQARDVPVSKVLNCMNGNSGLTSEEIYQTVPLEGIRYKVLSSSTKKETMLGEVPKCYINGKALKIFEDREGILVARNGRAGTTFYLEKGRYAITDHAYIVYLRENCPYQISIKWLMTQYASTFLEYSSSSDNGTWNMTGFFENTKLDIPSYSEQVDVVNAYAQLEQIEQRILFLNEKIVSLLNRQVVT